MNRHLAVGACREPRGFTLVEVLIAITITLLIVPLAVDGVRSGLGTWERLKHHGDDADRARAAQRLLRRQISEALPITAHDADGVRRVAFRGSNAELQFVARLPLRAAGGGLFTQRVRITGRGDRKALTLSYWALDGSDAGTVPEEEIVNVTLATGVKHGRFDYFGSWRLGEKPDWHAQWENRRDLPRRVRLRIERQGNGARTWSELIIPVYAAAASG